MTNDTMTLENLLDFKEFQHLLDEFFTLTGVPMGISDCNNNILVTANNKNIEDGNINYVTTEMNSLDKIPLSMQINGNTKFNIPTSHFIHERIEKTIFIEEQHVATIFINPFSENDDFAKIPTNKINSFKKTILKTETKKTTKRKSIYTEDQLAGIINFTSSIAKIVSDLININYKLKTEIDQNSEQYMLLLEARKEAEQSNILKTEFLRNMEHEVRTPLNGIIGFTELLVLDKDNQKAELYKEYIQSAVYRLLDIMEKIIDYSRIQAGDIKITYTKTNIQEVLDLVIMKNTGKALQRRNKLHQMKTSDSVEVDIMIDVEKLTKMVEIVTENAIKFTLDGKIDFSGSITGKNLAIICIQDNGIGIPEEEAKNIFEPFRQVEIGLTRDYGGNGLGLAIAKAYADAMGGEIKIISTLGHGTRVEVSIPFNSV